MITDTELRITGLRALVDALGPVEAERFVALLLRESFDYTEWQHALWAELTVAELSRAAMEQRRAVADGHAETPS